VTPRRDRWGRFRTSGEERRPPPLVPHWVCQVRDRRGRFTKRHKPLKWGTRKGFGIGVPYNAIVINNE
jgi:hypothetical protein